MVSSTNSLPNTLSSARRRKVANSFSMESLSLAFLDAVLPGDNFANAVLVYQPGQPFGHKQQVAPHHAHGDGCGDGLKDTDAGYIGNRGLAAFVLLLRFEGSIGLRLLLLGMVDGAFGIDADLVESSPFPSPSAMMASVM